MPLLSFSFALTLKRSSCPSFPPSFSTVLLTRTKLRTCVPLQPSWLAKRPRNKLWKREDQPALLLPPRSPYSSTRRTTYALPKVREPPVQAHLSSYCVPTRKKLLESPLACGLSLCTSFLPSRACFQALYFPLPLPSIDGRHPIPRELR